MQNDSACAAPDAPAQLMQLRQSKLFRIFNHHHRGVGHIHADLHDRCGQQQLRLVAAEFLHHGFLFPAREPAMQQADPPRREDFFQMMKLPRGGLHPRAGIRLLHPRINDVTLPAFDQIFAEERPHFGQAFGGAQKCFYATPSRRRQFDHRNIQVSVKGQPKRPGNRRGRHHQQVRIIPLAHQLLPLSRPELVLFINDHQAQPLRGEGFLQQRMGADIKRAW